MQDDDNQLANTWAGKTVTISGKGGSIYVDNPEDYPIVVKTCYNKAILLEIVRAPPSLGLPNAVAFRVVGARNNINANNIFENNSNHNSNLYLTNVVYSDEQRQTTAETLSSIPSLLSDHIPTIIDFCMGRPTDEDNFEGAGFNYSPMTIQRGSEPNKLQLFELVSTNRNNYFGVRSLFGTYWRSQHWNQTVSQASHLFADETWYFNPC